MDSQFEEVKEMLQARVRGTAMVGDVMDRLLRNLANVDLNAPVIANPGAGGEDEDNDEYQDSTILVADNIPLETWNRFAVLDDLPRGLLLRQLVWDDGESGWLNIPSLPPHEIADDYCRCKFTLALADQLGGLGQMSLTGPSPNGGQVTYSPDCSLRPHPGIPGLQVPQGVVCDDWVTVIVEVMYYQQWATVYPKVAMYRQLAGVEYIFCVKMSKHLRDWSYELYDVGNNYPAFPALATQHSFDATHAQPGQHLVQFDSRRVLGLPQNAPLPGGCQDTAAIDVVELARNVRAYFPDEL